MKKHTKLLDIELIWIVIISTIYIILVIVSLPNGYFWDNIQQTSKEAHWYYWSNFKSIFIESNLLYEISSTSHPPLMGMMTAVLWKFFGYKLWVSHLFFLFWAVILLVNVWKLSRLFIDEKYVGFLTAIILLEPAVLTQFSIVSPDFILLTAFVITIRAVLEHKKTLLAIGIFFLCGISMRGIFTGMIVFAAHIYYDYLRSKKKLTFKGVAQTIVPYLPTFILLAVYYSLFIIKNKGLINSNYSEHYEMPNNLAFIARHFAGFVFRLLEYGRIILWILGAVAVYKLFKNRIYIKPHVQFVFLIFILLFGIYFLFVFITQMPFGNRYFMPLILLLTVITAYYFTLKVSRKTIFLFLLVLVFELTGHFWIYPKHIAQPWDATLAHLPYYELREKCFQFIEDNGIDYKDVSGGFCFYGDRGFVELANFGKKVEAGRGKRYFIYSNISADDDDIEDVEKSGRWKELARFEKGFVFVALMEKNNFQKESPNP